MRLAHIPVNDFPDATRNFEQLQALLPVSTIWVNILDPRWGVYGDGFHTDAAAIQAVFDHFNTLVANNGGAATIFFPAVADGYLLEKALIYYPVLRLIGEQSQYGQASTGDMASRLLASPTGTFTNTGTYGAPAIPALLKGSGVSAATTWYHGSVVSNLAFDPNGVAGLSAMASWQPGENSLYDELTCDGTIAVARTVNDSVTNTTVTVTSATAAFTVDDVNAVVTGTNIPAGTKIDRVISATQVTLNQAASGSTTGTLTINRPTDAFIFDGGSAHGTVGTLRGSHNTGAVLRLKNQLVATWGIGTVSGDNNGGGLVRISGAATNADPCTITIDKIKGENDVSAGTGSSVLTMDPVILLDGCDMVALNVGGGTAITGYSSRDIIRIDQPVTGRGGPSIDVCGLEANNPFNTGYANIVHDSSTGEVVAAPVLSGGALTSSNGARLYPRILWGRDLLVGGGGHVPSVDPVRSTVTFLPTPDVVYNASGWSIAQASTDIYGLHAYNTSNVQNDGAAWYINLSRGTWQLDLAGTQAGNQAIVTIDVSFDSGGSWTAVGTADQFGAGAQRWTFTGIGVPRGGPALVRFRALTRNGGSTGWVLSLSGMVWTRTA